MFLIFVVGGVKSDCSSSGSTFSSDENMEKVKEEDLDKQLIFKGLESQGEIVKEKYMEILSITYPES